MERKTGMVEEIEYTFDGFGNQVTTIDGKRYITYWDFSDGVEVGAKVEFTEREDANIRFGNVSLHGPMAENIRVIEAPPREPDPEETN